MDEEGWGGTVFLLLWILWNFREIRQMETLQASDPTAHVFLAGAGGVSKSRSPEQLHPPARNPVGNRSTLFQLAENRKQVDCSGILLTRPDVNFFPPRPFFLGLMRLLLQQSGRSATPI